MLKKIVLLSIFASQICSSMEVECGVTALATDLNNLDIKENPSCPPAPKKGTVMVFDGINWLRQPRHDLQVGQNILLPRANANNIRFNMNANMNAADIAAHTFPDFDELMDVER